VVVEAGRVLVSTWVIWVVTVEVSVKAGKVVVAVAVSVTASSVLVSVAVRVSCCVLVTVEVDACKVLVSVCVTVEAGSVIETTSVCVCCTVDVAVIVVPDLELEVVFLINAATLEFGMRDRTEGRPDAWEAKRVDKLGI
jgi:hypothetical protein